MAEAAEVCAALEEVARLPHGQERCQQAERAVALADATADLSWQVRARTHLATSYAFGDPGKHELALTVWQLKALDEAGTGLPPNWNVRSCGS